MIEQPLPSSAQIVALFVFIPFCKIKCTYCDFNAYANMGRLIEPYIVALEEEIRSLKVESGRGLGAKSLFFGGGTPSLVSSEHLARIIRACRECFAFKPDAEITLEMNPGTADLEKLQSYRAMGVNRLSLGIQSFDDKVLRRLNRGHTIQDAMNSLDWARRAGFENINLDLIYGLPYQTLDEWREALNKAIDIRAEHLSMYALQVEEGTGLDFQIKSGKYPRPDDNLAADMYELTEESLDRAGYEHYEISNWARHDPHDGTEKSSQWRSQHNLTYWKNEPYLGFGAGAHSSFAGSRYWNVLSPMEYIERIRRGAGVEDGREKIGRALTMSETMILGLRLREGVSFEGFRHRHGQDLRESFSAVLHEMAAQGLLELDEESVRLTSRGRLLSNQVFWRLLP